MRPPPLRPARAPARPGGRGPAPTQRPGRGLGAALSIPLAITTLAIAGAGCAQLSAPPPPAAAPELPAQWRAEAPWREARPRDAEAKGDWWTVFGDAELDALQQRAAAHNQDLARARARWLQARALARASDADRVPQLGASARAGRQQPAENRATYSNSLGASQPQSEAALQLQLSWELDLFGRIGHERAAAAAQAGQAEAELENTRLLIAADLARLYFGLRAADIEIDVLRQSIDSQQRARDLLEARHSGGAASGLDRAQQQALIDATRTQLELQQRLRLQLEHALATLAGSAAGTLQLPADSPGGALRPLPEPPPVALHQPSDLLERRPDIAAAARAVAAANAEIGVARAAGFPSLVLGAGTGLQSRALSSLGDAGSLLWSFGSTLAVNAFDGGRNRARVEASRAAHDAAVAAWRQTVLRAVQEVEDALGSLQALARAATHADAAVASAGRVLDIATARYEGGATSYLDVVNAQQSVLDGRRLAAQLQGQRLAASVLLVKALGGDFEAPAREAPARLADAGLQAPRPDR